MEYAVPVWNPYAAGDIAMLEKVQKRATRIPASLKGVPYANRLMKLGLTSLKERRDRGDALQKFKLDKGFEKVKWLSDNTQPPLDRPIRRNNRRIKREVVKHCEQRYHFFNNRIVNMWNSLPENTVSAQTVDKFKEAYDLSVNSEKNEQRMRMNV